MRYYSEGTVKKIMKVVKVDYVPTSQYDSSLCTEEREYPRLENFPSIEIPDKHGQIVEGDKVLECLASILEKHDYIMVRDNLIKSVPILLEESE